MESIKTTPITRPSTPAAKVAEPVRASAPALKAAEPAPTTPAKTTDEFDLRVSDLDSKPKLPTSSVARAAAAPAPAPAPAPAAPAPAPAAPAAAAPAAAAPVPAYVRPAPNPETAELEKNEPDHAKARRFARVAVSEIKLYHEDEVKAGRAAKDLWKRLNQDIMMSIQTYEKRVSPEVRGRFDYLYDELVRQLAEGKVEALGPEAPTSTANAAPLKKK